MDVGKPSEPQVGTDEPHGPKPDQTARSLALVTSSPAATGCCKQQTDKSASRFPLSPLPTPKVGSLPLKAPSTRARLLQRGEIYKVNTDGKGYPLRQSFSAPPHRRSRSYAVLSLDLDPRGSSLLFSPIHIVSLFIPPFPQPPFSYRPFLFFSSPRLQLF